MSQTHKLIAEHNLTYSNITAEEWESITDKNYASAAKEKNSALQLRSYVDTLLKQITDDLREQYNAVNEAFNRRILETKSCKTKLETQHYEVNIMLISITRFRQITQLEFTI